MKFLKGLLVILLIQSCGPIVNYDYDINTDFNNLKTYAYFDDINTGLSALDTKRIVRTLDKKLQSLGLERRANNPPDFRTGTPNSKIE